MIPTIQCPACHARLKVPEPAPEGPLVCPQCGGTVSLHTEPTVPHRPVPPPPLEESLTKQRLPPSNRATDEDGLMPRPPKPGTEGSNASSIVVHVLAALGIAVISETMLLSYGNSGPVLVLAHMILGGIGVALELNRRPAPKAIGMVIIGFYALIGSGSLVLLALAILMFVICIAARA